VIPRRGRDLLQVARERDILFVATDPDPNRARKMKDEEIVVKFFAGDGSDAPQYPPHDSTKEKEARAALARIVRDYVPGFSGEMLALAVDPDMPSRFIGMRPLRKIRFESVARGKASTWRRDLHIADFIRKEISNTASPGKDGVSKPKIEAVLKAAEEQFGISRATAQRVWKEHEQAMAIADAEWRLGALMRPGNASK
jgi:hypothetical protein